MDTDILISQYDLVKSSREVVFNYCKSMAPQHFVQGVEFFNGKSIRDLLVHVANTYRFWLEEFGMGKNISFYDETEISGLMQTRNIYEEIHAVVDAYLIHFSGKLKDQVSGIISSRNMEVTTTPIALFTHVLTHEFHHKGQIMSMGRSLGYEPPDADVIRT